MSERKKPQRKAITKRAVDAMQPGESIADDEVRGFVVRRLPSGTATYGYRYMNAAGAQRWLQLGLHGKLTPDKARTLAKKAAGHVADGKDPVAEKEKARTKAKAEKAETLQAVCEDYLKRKCGMQRDEAGNATFEGDMRSARERLRAFEKHVWPVLGKMPIATIRRSQIAKLMDAIEDEAGPSGADGVLAHLSTMFNWYASRTDDFVSPIVRGMRRVKARERARKRTLTDEEIRDIWQALDEGADELPSCYLRFVRTLLLTALRRCEASDGSYGEVATISWDDFSGAAWEVPAARMKNKLDHVVPLSPAVLALVGKSKDKARPFIFSTTNGRRPFSGFAKAKADLDSLITEIRKKGGRPPMPQWQHHDLRRTAKTLMQRAGVRPDISERVLSHVVAGVEGTYDRWGYLPEKRDALERLAALIEGIVNPPAAANVVKMRAAVQPCH